MSMKTTVNLPDELVREAQEVARRERTMLRELIEPACAP
jgi:predicted transcriptional regulator